VEGYKRASHEADDMARPTTHVLAVFLELLQRIFRLGAASLRHRQTLEVGHEKVDGRLEFVDVRALHLLDDEPRKRSFLLQTAHTPTTGLNDHLC